MNYFWLIVAIITIVSFVTGIIMSIIEKITSKSNKQKNKSKENNESVIDDIFSPQIIPNINNNPIPQIIPNINSEQSIPKKLDNNKDLIDKYLNQSIMQPEKNDESDEIIEII